MERIDTYPTHTFQAYSLRLGHPYPFGATVVPGGINFSIFSHHADRCTLVLFQKGETSPLVEIPFRGEFKHVATGDQVTAEFRIGNVFAMTIFGLDYESVEYGYRVDGPYPRAEPGKPALHRFDPDTILMDPYAKAIGGRDSWGRQPEPNDPYPHRARVVVNDFDWEGDRPLELPLEDLIIYEMHLRGFTRHASAGVKHPGTFAALREKIPYLKSLGVNCVELMPIFEFDEFEHSRLSPVTGERLLNYWGYSTVGFFAPKAGYAATGPLADGTMVIDELKHLVKLLHRNGIEIILDVVFNHTAEGNENGPTISLRGIDNATYYMLTPEGDYFNFSGTGNTLNCNNPIVRDMVLDALRYWASEFHIDGFRFDLASILGRDSRGAPMANPPLLETLAYDPILGKCKLIAEAWDAGGLYQVGSFPAFGRWAEWNGRYRDTMRKFLKGDDGQLLGVAQAIQGSPEMYLGRGTAASINFITCHDGFTMADLFSYNQKHNLANGEDNRDGANDNNSWNCGWEGHTDDSEINLLRKKLIKNAFAMLMVSQGVPMILMGDEAGRSQQGNNNTYCHDSELTWFDWSQLEANQELLHFVTRMLAFRRRHPALRHKEHLSHQEAHHSGFADITWHGTRAWHPDWSGRAIAFMLSGRDAAGPPGPGGFIYVGMNMHWDALPFELPRLPDELRWHVAANTGAQPPEDIWEEGAEPAVRDPGAFLIAGRSVIILVSR